MGLKEYKIILFQRLLASYRIPVFSRLCREFKLLVCYSDLKKTSDVSSYAETELADSMRIKALRYGLTPTAIIQNPVKILRKYRPGIVISEGAPSYLTLWLLLFIRPLYGYKLVVWSHGVKYEDMAAPFRTIRSRIQLWIFNKADSVLIYSPERAEIVRKHINNPAKVFVAFNTLDTDQLRIYYDKFIKSGKESIKNELGFNRKYNLIYIGRILRSKGIEDLIKAYNTIKSEFDIALHIVGNGPEMNRLKDLLGGTSGVKTYGALYGTEETGKLLFSSDLMIMPGYVGLSVVHAFSFGCPVITYIGSLKNSPSHSPEVEYITDRENGLFCDPDTDELVSAIRKVLEDPEKLLYMSEKAADTAYSKASVLNMIAGFREAIMYLKNT